MKGPSCWDSDDSDLEISCARRGKVKKTAEFSWFLDPHKLKLPCTSQCETLDGAGRIRYGLPFPGHAIGIIPDPNT